MQLIYRLTSPTGRVYIGQTKNLRARMSCYRTLKCRAQTLLHHSLKKYGFENHAFEVLFAFPMVVGQAMVDDTEQRFIQLEKYVQGSSLLNLTLGGRGNGHRKGQTPRLRPDVQGEKHRLAKLTEADVREIREYYQRGVRGRGLRQIAQLWSISLRGAYNVVKRKSWAHVV